MLKIVQEENEMAALQRSKFFCVALRISDVSSVGYFNDEESRKIDQCTDFRELFFHLHHHWDWNDLVLLESIVHLCETKEEKQEMTKYRRKLVLYGGLNLV